MESWQGFPGEEKSVHEGVREWRELERVSLWRRIHLGEDKSVVQMLKAQMNEGAHVPAAEGKVRRNKNNECEGQPALPESNNKKTSETPFATLNLTSWH